MPPVAVDRLEIYLTADQRYGRPGDPDSAVVVARDVHPAAPPERGPLAHDVGRACSPRLQQPLRERGVELPVTGSSTTLPSTGKKARTSNAHSEPAGQDPAIPTSRSADVGRTASAACALSGSTAIQPGRCPPTARRRSRPGQSPAGQRPAPASARRLGPARSNGRRGEAVRCLPDRDQASKALLHDQAGTPGLVPGARPGMASAQGRMAGERQLGTRGEDPHPDSRRPAATGLPPQGAALKTST